MLRVLGGLLEALVSVEIGVLCALHQYLGHTHQCLGIVRIQGQYLLAHSHHQVGVVGVLGAVHRRAIKQKPAVSLSGNFVAKSLADFSHGRRIIDVCDRCLIRVIFGLRFGWGGRFPWGGAAGIVAPCWAAPGFAAGWV